MTLIIIQHHSFNSRTSIFRIYVVEEVFFFKIYNHFKIKNNYDQSEYGSFTLVE